MLRNAKFNLVNRHEKSENFVPVQSPYDELGRRRMVTGRCRFEVQCQVQFDCTSDGICDETNNKICKILEMRLAEQLPRNAPNAWKLSLKFSTAPSGILKVTARGKILKHLQSLMSYDARDTELKLMLSADLYSGDFDYDEDEDEEPTAKYRTELHPLARSENWLDHSTYLDTEGSKAIFDDITSVDNIKIWIEGVKKKSTKSNSTDFMPLLMEKGLGPELTLQYKIVNAKEDNSPIRVHENIIIDQSPVIKTMLEHGKFVEGATRIISMAHWTKQEVTALVYYLYFGDLELALNNPTLAVTLYEMAHYYDVKSLEGAIKTVLLNMTVEAEPWKPDDCIRLFKTANSANDCGLKQLAVEMLKLSAGLSNGTSLQETFSWNEVMPQEMLLMSMKFE